MSKRIPILIIVENLPLPFDTRVWKEALALTEHGYEVFAICPKSLGYDKSYEKLQGIHIYRHPMPKEGSGALGYVVEYISALFWEFLYSWRIFFRVRFKVIQGCNPPDTIFLVAAPFKLFGVKYVFDHHDVCPELYKAKFGTTGFMYKLLLWFERLTFRSCDVAMSTNESYRDIAIRRGDISPEDVFVVRNGPDADQFKPVAPNEEYRNGKRYLVGYVGTMAEQEGIDILLDVADFVRKQRRNDVQFVLVGGGPSLDELRIMCAEMGLDDFVTFVGRVPDADLIQILSTSDVCVNPDKVNTMNDMSTMIKIMEYCALSKPIVQFDLKEGRYSAQEASLYAENSVEDFARKILWLLDHPEDRARMGKIGRDRVANKLAWHHSVPSLIAAYERALTK